MKNKLFKFEIVTPSRIIYQAEAKHVRLPAADGYLGIKCGHAPLVTTLTIGEITVDLEDASRYFAVSGGVVEVLPDKTTVLVETAEEASEIDISRATEARDRAVQRLKDRSQTIDRLRAEVALQKARNRLKVTKEIKSTPAK